MDDYGLNTEFRETARMLGIALCDVLDHLESLNGFLLQLEQQAPQQPPHIMHVLEKTLGACRRAVDADPIAPLLDTVVCLQNMIDVIATGGLVQRPLVGRPVSAKAAPSASPTPSVPEAV